MLSAESKCKSIRKKVLIGSLLGALRLQDNKFWRGDETVCVVGLGYVGLPAATLMADAGFNVIGFDTNPIAVAKINAGEIHIREPGLAELVARVVFDKKLRANLSPEKADVFVIAVPTPFIGDHEPDLSFVKKAARSIAPVLQPSSLVLLESTSPVGTTEMVGQILAELRNDLQFAHKGVSEGVSVAYCPERVLPGNALVEMMNNDRVVGGLTEICTIRAVNFYGKIIKGKCTLTDARTAEMCKLTENSFRDLNIAFANELSIICDQLKINVWELIRLANLHPRVKILQPGPGVGGHCIAVDPWFIVNRSPDEARLIRTAREVNDAKPEWVLGKVADAVAKITKEIHFDKKREIKIACFGLSFKANIDDFRESPALHIAKAIGQKHVGPILVVEPNLLVLPQSLSKKFQLVDLATALKESDVLLLLVDHDEFKLVNPKNLGPHQILIDTKGIWSESSTRKDIH